MPHLEPLSPGWKELRTTAPPIALAAGDGPPAPFGDHERGSADSDRWPAAFRNGTRSGMADPAPGHGNEEPRRTTRRGSFSRMGRLGLEPRTVGLKGPCSAS